MTEPDVSVVIVTYNHERFIRQAVESVLSQCTAFPFEIIISEDCSTDRTREIVQSFQRQYPNQIRLMLSESNQNDNAVLTRAFEVANGSLVALLDGDDYWISTLKLQRQRDYLFEHPEQSACFHNALVVYEDGERPPKRYNADTQGLLTGEDLWAFNPVSTCTVMFRRSVIEVLPEWYRTATWETGRYTC